MTEQTKTGLFRTTIVVEVLHEGKYHWDSLYGVAYDIADGECSGKAWTEKVEELSQEDFKVACIGQGSDPEFFLTFAGESEHD